MATSLSPEAKEIALIDKVELKIALTDTDSKLQAVLKTYLPPLLLKLASEHVSVRNKVISICQHINARTKPQDIQLPVAALLKQFNEHPNSQLVRHFDLVYIQQGVPRLSSHDRAALVPVLAGGISKISAISASHASIVFNLFLRCLIEYQLPPKGSPAELNLRSSLGLSDDDAEFLALWTGRLVLFRSSSQNQSSSVLSQEEREFLIVHGKPEVWDPSSPVGLNLAQAKINTSKLISSAAFSDDERLLPGLFAASDSNSRISEIGDAILKQALPNVDTNKSSLISKLFDLYTASSGMIPLRIKILNLLSKNPVSTTFPQKIARIADQGLTEDTTRTDREATKLQAAIVQLLTFAAKRSELADLQLISKDVVQKVKDFLDQQHSDAGSPEMKALRGRCFEVLGFLAGACSGLLLEPDLTLLRWMFRSLAEEKDKDVVFSIDEAISGALRPFQQDIPEELMENLKSLLLDVLDLDSLNQRNTRFACIRFANRCLPFGDITARWIDISVLGAVSIESHELVEEARKGLDPYWHRLFSGLADGKADEESFTASLRPPDFAEMVLYIFGDQKAATKDNALLPVAISFCRKCLYWMCTSSGEHPIDYSVDWERKMDAALSQDQAARHDIRKAIATKIDGHHMEHTKAYYAKEALTTLFQGAIKGLRETTKSRSSYISTALELASLSPEPIVQEFASSFTSLQTAMLGNDIETRRMTAKCFGILASHRAVDSKALDSTLTILFQALEDRTAAVGQQLNQAHGALISIAYFVSRKCYRGLDDSTCQGAVKRLLPHVIDVIRNSSDTTLQGGAYEALGQLCMFSVIDVGKLTAQGSIKSLMEKIGVVAKSGNEKAVACLGHIALILDEQEQEDDLRNLTELIRGLHEIRQVESQFVVGEALSCLACGWDSTALLPNLDIDGQIPQSRSRSTTSKKLLDTIIADSKTNKPAMKKASVIWLLCLLQFCAGREEVQQRLPDFQVAFKRCLSNRDELVQESASRGLGLVYEKGSRELKDDLVRDLVGSFSSNKADMSGTVTEETQLFEPGALPTGEGSITTYKDIMSLAAEVGDSSLVYRFMSLASNNAIWSSRAAFGRFGLSNVLSDSSVDGYLANNPKLYPKLFRYRFDPNSNVRRSMNDIWNALVKDSAATIYRYFDSILDDLLVNMVGREWRARQASCAAVADLVQGQRLLKVQPHLERIWDLCFKVLDDIKESVRAAAAELARVLSNLLVRNLESNEGKGNAIEQLLKIVLPFLLSTSGLESSAKEVQAFSLHTLLDIIKKGKPHNLLPFVPELVQQLLGLLSTFEHEAVNYMSLNATNYKLQQSDIDDYRLKSIRSSPLMEAIERCLDTLNEEAMAQLSPRLQEAMKTAVGVPSKVGISRVLVSLSTRRNFVFRPFADQQLVALRKRIMDRNETVSSSYAASIGYVSRLATDTQMLKTVAFARQLYFGDEESDRARYTAGEILQAMAKYATDRFNALASDILPFVFFGKFDDEKRVRDIFTETYNETASGPRAATLYLAEIVKVANDNLASKRWTFKHAAALSISEAIKAVATSQSSITKSQGEILWPSLQSALAEKSWDGKEKVLEGFVMIVEKGGEFWRCRPDMGQELIKISVRESRRRNRAYQPAALASMGKIAKAVPDIDCFDDVYGIVKPLLEEAKDAMQIDDSKDMADLDQEDLVRSAIEACFGALEAQVDKSGGQGLDLSQRMILLLDSACVALGANVANHTQIQDTVFASIQTLLNLFLQLPESLQKIMVDHSTGSVSPSSLSARLAHLLSTSNPPLQYPLQEKPRLTRADALRTYAQCVANDKYPLPDDFSLSLTAIISEEKSPQILNVLHKAQQSLANASLI